MTNHYPLQEFYGRLTGIWQDVYLRAIPKRNVAIGLNRDVGPKEALAFPVTVSGAADAVEVRARVLDGTKAVLELPPRKTKGGTVQFSSPQGDLKLWGIGGKYGEPQLYFLEVQSVARRPAPGQGDGAVRVPANFEFAARSSC